MAQSYRALGILVSSVVSHRVPCGGLEDCLFEGRTRNGFSSDTYHGFLPVICALTDLPAADFSVHRKRPKLQRDADSEGVACALQPSLLPVRLPYLGNSGGWILHLSPGKQLG